MSFHRPFLCRLPRPLTWGTPFSMSSCVSRSFLYGTVDSKAKNMRGYRANRQEMVIKSEQVFPTDPRSKCGNRISFDLTHRNYMRMRLKACDKLKDLK